MTTPTLVDRLNALKEISSFFQHFLQQHPQLADSIDWLALPDETIIKNWIERCFDGDENDIATALRIIRKKISAIAAFRQFHQLSDFAEIATLLSNTANHILNNALTHLHQQQCRIDRLNNTPPPLLIIAMGKLGGGELNFSSDIDLIFVYENAERFVNVSQKEIEAERFYIQISRKLINLLDEVNEEGFVYRVDMRLRPFGDGAPLAISMKSLENYLLKHGRDWERYAYLKAYVLTGRETAKRRLTKLIDDFTYRHYFDYKMIAAIRQMKISIIQQMDQKILFDNIKLGRGGIREIEFIVQCFQLVYGGQNQKLRKRSLKQALFALSDGNHIKTDEALMLYDNYVFLRAVENALQMLDEQQIHKLPDSSQTQNLLSAFLHTINWESLKRQIDHVRLKTQHLFDALTQFHIEEEIQRQSNTPDQKIMTTGVSIKTDDEISSSQNQFLATHNLSDDEKRLVHDCGNILRRLNDIDTDRVAPQFFKLLHTLSRRKNYFYLLQEKISQVKDLLMLMNYGEKFGAMITRYPFLLERALNIRSHHEVYLTRQALNDKLVSRLKEIDLDDSETFLETLRRFKLEQTFNIITAECRHKITLMEASDVFSHLAEVIIMAVVDGAWRALIPDLLLNNQQIKRLKSSLAIIAYGKLGGFELSISSDLDLIFLYQTHKELEDSQKIYIRIVQKFVHYMQIETYNGKLYEIDLRLRPDGNSGLLVSSMDSFEKYQRQHAWIWEYQALTRARVIIADSEINRRFETLRREILQVPRKLMKLKDNIRGMRHKMRQQIRFKPDIFDLKQSPGGMIDIEFIAQYFALAYSHQHHEIGYYSDSIRIIQSMDSAGLISLQWCQTLIDGYCFLRDLSIKCFLNNRPPEVKINTISHISEPVLLIWRHIFAE
ncbi:MAG: bifunctional [glutamate--ammonia ligase]-adenylyl-L-tyrosine phosphorylase/[glutamate--ammonia-ligase] adenylyltransferase [Francisellaceae bacterium]